MPSNVLVANAGIESVNGTYTYRGIYNNKPYYNLAGYPNSTNRRAIAWSLFSVWYIYSSSSNSVAYLSNQDTEYPWLVNSWDEPFSNPGAPTVTEVPSEPTFGLPADVVALITARFGTVANYLRLRNQGQI